MTACIIDNKGDKLFSTYQACPNCESVILLHGGPGFVEDLSVIAEQLAWKFQVIQFDQRGTRRSPCKSGDYSMDAYVSDINAIASYFNLQKFHLFGHSWGGLYAQIYAQQNPDRLLSLFLCCPGSGTGGEWKQTEKEVLQYNRSKCTTAEWINMGINSLFGMLGSDKAYKRLFKQVMKNYNKDFINRGNWKIDLDNVKAAPVNRTREGIKKYPILKPFGNQELKITIVYGVRDIYGSSKEFVFCRYPAAKVWTIENCGHNPWLHNPLEFAKILNSHFSQ
jgi:proline iminopeptidase